METKALERVAPGCFGAASVYGSDSRTCRACFVFDSCGEESIKTLERIRESIDVRDLLARHSKTRALMNVKTPEPSETPVADTVEKPKAPVVRNTPVERVTYHIEQTDEHVIATLTQKNVKVGKQALVLCKSNKISECRAMLPKGINPFADSTPRFFAVACDLLIRGGFTKASLKSAFMSEFNWTDNTAGSHVAIAFGVLWGFGLIKTDEQGNNVLNPELGR